MPRLRKQTIVFFTVAALAGCAGPRRQLHALSGDAFTLFPPGDGQPPPITCSGPTRERFACLTRELEQRAKAGGVSGSLAIVPQEGVPLAMSVRDASQSVAITADTRFPIGSITKMFLAAAAVSASEAGLVSLGQPIADYLPELDRSSGPGVVTLDQLLTHTAGIPVGAQCDRASDPLGVAAAHRHTKLWSPPGAVYNYSNLGYTFVAAVLERVTHQPFEQVVADRVLRPVGITGASFDPDTTSVKSAAPPGAPHAPYCRAMRASGGLVLSANELGRWAHALAQPDSSALGRALVERLTAHRVQTGSDPSETYGYGISRVERNGLVVYDHSGRLSDFSAYVAWVPERSFAVAALANTPQMLPVVAGLRALSTFLDAPASWRPPLTPSHSLESYTGTYVDTAGTLGRVHVGLEDGELVFNYVGQPPALLAPAFTFFFKGSEPKARYIASAIGVGERVETTQ